MIGRSKKEISIRIALYLIAFLIGVFILTGKDFSYSTTMIDPSEIQEGGPPKDGIPSLSDPDFIGAAEAGYMRDDDKVIGLTIGGIPKAYPIRILSHHEAVNDTSGPIDFLVTW